MGNLNGKLMVNASDVERSMLEVALQVVRDFPHIRRADGRKSPHMLCGEEALRLRTVVRARDQELETLRAQLRLWIEGHETVRLQNEASKLGVELLNACERAEILRAACSALSGRLSSMIVMSGLREDSAWFRLGRWIGFYT